MKKHLKKIIIVLIILVIALVGVFVIYPKLTKAPPGVSSTGTPVAYIKLKKSENLKSTVSSSGTVQSTESKDVYSKLTGYPVEELLVEEGDKVQAGELLCKMDVSSLKKDIEQQQASINATEHSADVEYESSRKSLSSTKGLYSEGLNAQIVNAEAAVDSAEMDLDQSQTDYINNLELFEIGEISETEMSSIETRYENAQINLDKAKKSLESAREAAKMEIQNAQSAVNRAAAQGDTTSMKKGIEKLQDEIKKAEVFAPISGTLTQVNAVEGASATGKLFVIEDTDSLEVVGKVKEYDRGKIKVGQKVIIKSDATDDEEIPGEVTYISLAAINSATTAASNAGVEFETKIKVLENNPALLIGMNARLTIIIEEKSEVFSTTYDLVVTKPSADNPDKDANFIYVLEVDGEDPTKYVVREIPVDLGLETDFEVEIISDKIKEGMLVLENPSGVTPGDKFDIAAVDKNSAEVGANSTAPAKATGAAQ